MQKLVFLITFSLLVGCGEREEGQDLIDETAPFYLPLVEDIPVSGNVGSSQFGGR